MGNEAGRAIGSIGRNGKGVLIGDVIDRGGRVDSSWEGKLEICGDASVGLPSVRGGNDVEVVWIAACSLMLFNFSWTTARSLSEFSSCSIKLAFSLASSS